MSRRQIVNALGIHNSTVSRVLLRYATDGNSLLHARPFHRSSPSMCQKVRQALTQPDRRSSRSPG
ncbi:hypothetical protein IIE25_17530 [Cobetia sp. 2AS1]|nr:hypothetical protein [Cobetia sp. 2AS1]